MRLWRASSSTKPWFGRASCWTETRDDAEVYLSGQVAGFGGDALYVADVDADTALILGAEPWDVVAEVVGMDRADYGAGESDADLLASLVPVFEACGYGWVVYHDHDVRGPGAITWLRCSSSDLDTRRVNDDRVRAAVDVALGRRADQVRTSETD